MLTYYDLLVTAQDSHFMWVKNCLCFHPQINHGSDAYLVMSSDGLSHTISDQEIVNIVNSCQTPQEACSRLTDQAQHFGSEDNVTVVVIPLGAWGKYQKLATDFSFHIGRVLSNSKFYQTDFSFRFGRVLSNSQFY